MERQGATENRDRRRSIGPVVALAIVTGLTACNPGSLDGLQNGHRSDSGAPDLPSLKRDGEVFEVQTDTSIVQIGETPKALDVQPKDSTIPDEPASPEDRAADKDRLDGARLPTLDSADTIEQDAPSLDLSGNCAEVEDDGAATTFLDAGEDDGPGGSFGTGGTGAGGGDGTGGDRGSGGGSGGVTGTGGSGGSTGAGGKPGAGGMTGSGGTVTMPDAASDARRDAPRPCAGVADSEICWYLGRAGDSCANACANHGGTSAQAPSHIGTPAQGGSLSECSRLLSLLGIQTQVTSGTRSDGLGFGCHLFGSEPWWLTSPAYSDTVKNPVVQFVCGCLQ